ncbi:MAG: hypothetical protein EPN47_00245 [Acidobacteria bacterium]|nr:MAG: hypothetical protein EPN47_00245 [Acidobacteriota bacterium]
MALRVECDAGYRAVERPLRFRFLERESRTFEVVEVVDQWHGVGYRCFKVLADDKNTYILRHIEQKDEWVLDSFRRANP